MSRGGRSSGSRSYGSHARPVAAHPPQSSGPGFGSMLMTGMALGGGSAIGHEVVRGVMGSGSHNAPAQQQVV